MRQEKGIEQTALPGLQPSGQMLSSATWRSASSSACATIRSTELMPGTMMRRRRHSPSVVLPHVILLPIASPRMLPPLETWVS
jgi:hypothetical protein